MACLHLHSTRICIRTCQPGRRCQCRYRMTGHSSHARAAYTNHFIRVYSTAPMCLAQQIREKHRTSLTAKDGQVKWEMKLLVSTPNAVSRLSPSWSLPTVTTDKTCTTHASTLLQSSLHHLAECELQELKGSHGSRVLRPLQGHAMKELRLNGVGIEHGDNAVHTTPCAG